MPKNSRWFEVDSNIDNWNCEIKDITELNPLDHNQPDIEPGLYYIKASGSMMVEYDGERFMMDWEANLDTWLEKYHNGND